MTWARLRPRLLAVLALLLAAVGGVAAGVALDQSMSQSRHLGFLARGTAFRPPPNRHPRSELLDRLDASLDLSGEQRIRVDSVLARREADMRALRDQVRPRFDSIASRTRTDLLQILSPEQRVRFEKLGRGAGHDK
jgi:chromatin segregation and condensation protein Rec8/ScpA/Scc1 (kleisin family)